VRASSSSSSKSSAVRTTTRAGTSDFMRVDSPSSVASSSSTGDRSFTLASGCHFCSSVRSVNTLLVRAFVSREKRSSTMRCRSSSPTSNTASGAGAPVKMRCFSSSSFVPANGSEPVSSE
jgi:hypothetical protein